MTLELEQLKAQIAEKQIEINILDQQIKQRHWQLGWSATKQEYVIRQLRAAIQTVLENPIYRGGQRCARDYVPQIQATLTRVINDRIDDLLAISQMHISERQIKDYSRLAKESGFAPVPPPLLDSDVPNKSGIYFIWEGSVVAYVGQSKNLAQRLFKHERLKRGDKISYLCVDSSDLFYHEAFYIGVCRPWRNGRGTPMVMNDL